MKQRPKLDQSKIRYLVAQCRKGRTPSSVAPEMGVSKRHCRRLWARFCDTGHIPVLSRPGRPRMRITASTYNAIIESYKSQPMGVSRMTKLLGKSLNTSQRTIYRIMKSEGVSKKSKRLQQRRKWVRYERRYSNAMWHTDWHVLKDPRFSGTNLIAYLDDASRCVTGFGMFADATSENAVKVLRDAMGTFGRPASILSDNGAQFVSTRRRAHGRSWTPTLFEEELIRHDVSLINSRPHHPQTNGKLERFFRTLEEELPHFEGMLDFMAYYNERRLHWSLDIDNHQYPLQAFHDKRATDAIRKGNPKWMEEDTDDGRT